MFTIGKILAISQQIVNFLTQILQSFFRFTENLNILGIYPAATVLLIN